MDAHNELTKRDIIWHGLFAVLLIKAFKALPVTITGSGVDFHRSGATVWIVVGALTLKVSILQDFAFPHILAFALPFVFPLLAQRMWNHIASVVRMEADSLIMLCYINSPAFVLWGSIIVLLSVIKVLAWPTDIRQHQWRSIGMNAPSLVKSGIALKPPWLVTRSIIGRQLWFITVVITTPVDTILVYPSKST